MNSENQHNTSRQWRKALLPAHATLQDAIACLDGSALQIALVVTESDKLVGTITDGDIRRGLLRGLGIDSPIDSVLQGDPMVVPPKFSQEMVLQLMESNSVRQLPIVDISRTVVGLHTLDELRAPKQRSNVMVIMAGGKGTRLRPHTHDCPKPLLPVAGKPMLEHIIERAKGEGFHNFVLSVNYLGHMIEEHFGNGSALQVDISYLREDMPLGTAGALSLLRSQLSEPFLVTNGDVLTDIHYAELLDFHNRHDAMATMAVRLHEWQHPFGVVHIDGIEISGFEEKPVSQSHVNAGIYVLDSRAIDCLESNQHCDMPMLFARLQNAGSRTIVYPMHEPWLDVGRPEDYAAANEESFAIAQPVR